MYSSNFIFPYIYISNHLFKSLFVIITLAWTHPFTSIIAGPTSWVPIQFIEGLQELNDVAPESNLMPRIITVDDLMRQANGQIVDLFSKGSHHRNLSVIQVCPENAKFLQESFADTTSKPHSYLQFDMKQNTPEAFRFRTDIFL
ncbi:hypothetical protein B566_EDAN015259, partial [Ephemera danica]